MKPYPPQPLHIHTPIHQETCRALAEEHIPLPNPGFTSLAKPHGHVIRYLRSLYKGWATSPLAWVTAMDLSFVCQVIRTRGSALLEQVCEERTGPWMRQQGAGSLVV